MFAGLFILAVCTSIGYYFHGRIGLEKVLTRFAYPLGAGWLLLAAWTFQFLLAFRIRSALIPLVCLIGLTLSSISPTVDLVVRYLEGQVEAYDPTSGEQLDAIVVLGGGTQEGPTRAEANHSGDRVLYAAQLYLQGHVRQLISTGGNAIQPMLGEEIRGPADMTVEIWTKLNIPEEDIIVLDGLNTAQEFEAIKSHFESTELPARLGVLTSATHLSRAMRLAKNAGLSGLFPIAANHLAKQRSTKTFADCLPAAE